MPTQSTPRRNRSFGPLLGGTYYDQNMRVSDAERQAVADRLAEHYGEGRLDQAEFDERVGRAMSAKTRGDLEGLLDDLPEPGPAGAPGVPVRRRRRRHHYRLLPIVLIAVVAIAAVHAVAWMAAPWLWLGLVALIALFATGHIGHSHSHVDHSRVDGDR
jgi:hypothetical protein